MGHANETFVGDGGARWEGHVAPGSSAGSADERATKAVYEVSAGECATERSWISTICFLNSTDVVGHQAGRWDCCEPVVKSGAAVHPSLGSPRDIWATIDILRLGRTTWFHDIFPAGHSN